MERFLALSSRPRVLGVAERMLMACAVAGGVCAALALAQGAALACEDPPPAANAQILAPLPDCACCTPEPCDGNCAALVSGTNCKAYGRFTAATPSWALCWVEWAKLYVGGELVAQYQRQPGDDRRDVTLYVTWASTHFFNDTEIEVKIEGQDICGFYASRTQKVHIVNRAYVAAAQHPVCSYSGIECGAYGSAVHTECLSMKHETTGPVNCCEAATMLPGVPQYTVWFQCTHATNCQRIWDCKCGSGVFECDPNGPHKITNSDISSWVNQKSGCTQPPYNLVHLFGCCSCVSSCGVCEPRCCDFATAFGILTPPAGWGRALLGWCNKPYINDRSYQWNFAVWSHLAEGQNVGVAVSMANAEWPPEGEGGPPTALICGDAQTTLNSAYPGHPGNWSWPPLQQ